MRWWQRLLLFLVAVSLILAGFLLYSIRHLEVETLSDDLHVLRGLGGNTAVLRTDAGAVVVDTMTLPMQGARIRELTRALTGAETILLINTHYHLDHTHGNPAFEPGTRVISTSRTLSHLKALDADFWTGAAAKLLPGETFERSQILSIGNKTLELVHPGPGHTDGDLVVVFREESAVHMGDLLFNGHYPNIDLEAGGTVQGWPSTLDSVTALNFERVIPGHGPTTDREGIARFRAFMAQLGAIGQQAATTNQTLEGLLQDPPLTADAEFVPLKMIVPVGLDREFVLRRTWEEATGNFVLENP
ncbi:MAG: MBL fold metallo-hydrolase [Pseudomonadales bacterium]